MIAAYRGRFCSQQQIASTSEHPDTEKSVGFFLVRYDAIWAQLRFNEAASQDKVWNYGTEQKTDMMLIINTRVGDQREGQIRR